MLESERLPPPHRSGYLSDLYLRNRRYPAHRTPRENDPQSADSSIFGDLSQWMISKEVAFLTISMTTHLYLVAVMIYMVDFKSLKEVGDYNLLGSLELHTYFNALYFLFSFWRDSVLQSVIVYLESQMMRHILQYRITTIMVDCMVLCFSASALSLFLQQLMDQIKEEGGLASEHELLQQLKPN